ncbi:hypothetical protein [Cryptosporangium phraense]|uniref:Uncharacterized protein n=1 Tax=Cryptosporangium phraense TaxID=2593070 RepID=A0A545AR46_9ACTN|nr:hypothetical protein [Cryptosporangium phraense]TQS43175.1 hypothetical protein FL583_20220 [Cryptosporangium phraense]
MAETLMPVVLHDVLDPLTGDRTDVTFDVPGVAAARSDFDGSGYWVLPGVFDADAHLPLVPRGVREFDRLRALAGGVTQLNSATPWHLIKDLPLEGVTAFFRATTFPRMMPILSVSDQPSSADFPAWLAAHGDEIRETWAPVIKCYSNDPNFERTVEAIWAADCRAAIYFYDEAAFESVVADHGGPVHFRHVTSKTMADQVASRPDSTSQTSPHFLLELPEGRSEELFVLPPVPGNPARDTLRAIVADAVNLIASDHNAPIAGNKGPGLEIEQSLLPAVLSLVDDGVLTLPTAIEKLTTAAAAVFRPAGGLDDSRIVVDPTVSLDTPLWPGQEPRRAAFLGVRTTGSVIAATAGGRGTFL